MAKKKILVDPSADLRRDPAEDLLTVTTEVKPKAGYSRFNIFVPADNMPVYEDFKIYAKSVGMSVSELVNLFMAQTVEDHAAEIEDAKNRFEEARKHYTK